MSYKRPFSSHKQSYAIRCRLYLWSSEKCRCALSELPRRHNEVAVRATGGHKCLNGRGGRVCGWQGDSVIYVLLFVSTEQSLDMCCQSLLFISSSSSSSSSRRCSSSCGFTPNLNRGEAVLYVGKRVCRSSVSIRRKQMM